MNIRKKMILVIVTIILIPLMIVQIFTNITLSKYTVSILMSNVNMVNEKINNDFEIFTEKINKITLEVIYNDDIQNALHSNVKDYALEGNINRLLSMLVNDYVESIYYINNDGTVYSTGGSVGLKKEKIIESKIYKKLNNSYGKLFWSFNKDDIEPNIDDYYIFAARYIRSMEVDTTPGVLVVKIKPEVIERILLQSNLVENSHYLMLDEEGTKIYDQVNKNDIGSKIDNEILQIINKDLSGSSVENNKNGKSILTYNSHNTIGWKVVSIIPYNKAIQELKKLQVLSTQLAIIMLIIAILIAILFSLSFTKPIKEIVSNMRLIQKGDFNAKVNLNRKDEIGELSYNFNEMAKDIKILIETVKKDEEDLKEAEINSLIHQINPHFLYNTLDNIKMLANMSNDKRIGKLITALSKFCRISLSKGEKIISIKNEIEHVRNYLFIQKMRYGSLFNYRFEVQEELLDYRVIKFILQPIVENSIVHGFENIMDGGEIILRVFKNKEVIVFEVEDNGQGVTSDILNNLNNKVKIKEVEKQYKQNGYGIKNVNTRLKLSYGNDSCIQFSNNKQGGLTSKISIPIEII